MYVDDYFSEYEHYYNELKNVTNYSTLAESYMQEVEMAIFEFEGMKSFLDMSNMNGEYKKAISETINLLYENYKILKYNMDNSLIPTSEQLEKLVSDLEKFKYENDEYKALLAELNNLRGSKPIFKDENINRIEEQKWQNNINVLEQNINQKVTIIIELKNIVDETLNIIKMLETIIKNFDETFINSNYEIQSIQNDNVYVFCWKVDNIVYQLVSPVCKIDGIQKNVVLDEKYIIVYDMEKIKEELGEKYAKYYESFEECINQRLNGNMNYWYNFRSDNIRKYDTKMAISMVLDIALKDTYAANPDVPRSVIATLFTTNSIVKLDYGTSGNAPFSEGVLNIIKSGGTLDCIDVIRWSEFQDILADDPTGTNRMTNSKITLNPKNVMYHCSQKIDELSVDELSSIKAGDVLTAELIDDSNKTVYHIARVIGHTTIDGEKAIVVSQASGHGIGLINSVYKFSELDDYWYGIAEAEVIKDFAINGENSVFLAKGI